MILLFREDNTEVLTKKGTYIIKGNNEINVVEKSFYNELIECNPLMKKWLENGYLVVSDTDKQDNVKTDTEHNKLKEQDERHQESVKEATKKIKGK